MPVFNVAKPFTVNFPGSVEPTEVDSVHFEAGVHEVEEKRILDHWYFKANAQEVKPKKSGEAAKTDA